MGKYKVFDVCDYILHISPMTPKRLQKMLYFCYSFYLAANNKSGSTLENKLFENQFEAWIHGPVIPKVYRKYADYGMTEISCDELENDIIDVYDKKFLSNIVNGLCKYTTYQLEMISHNQEPWKKAREKYNYDEISKEKLDDLLIFKCFSKLVKNG